MPVNCQMCGVSMTTAEVTQRRDGVVGNWHADCAYMDYLTETAEPTGGDTFLHTILCARRHLIDKHAGRATEYP